MHNPRRSLSVLAVLARPADNLTSLVKESPNQHHTDNWFDRIAINYLSQSVQATTGPFLPTISFIFFLYIYIYIYIYISFLLL